MDIDIGFFFKIRWNIEEKILNFIAVEHFPLLCSEMK